MKQTSILFLYPDGNSYLDRTDKTPGGNKRSRSLSGVKAHKEREEDMLFSILIMPR